MKGSEQMTVVGTEVCIGHVLGIPSRNALKGPLLLHLDHSRDSSVSNTSSAFMLMDVVQTAIVLSMKGLY